MGRHVDRHPKALSTDLGAQRNEILQRASQHDLAELTHEAVALPERDEVIRHDQRPVVGPKPRERFDGRNPAAGEIEHGLVAQHDLLVRERLAQVDRGSLFL